MKKENKTKGRLTHITTNGGKKDPGWINHPARRSIVRASLFGRKKDFQRHLCSQEWGTSGFERNNNFPERRY